VELAMNIAKMLLIDMGVDLRRGNIGMTEKFLDHAKIGAVPQ
jgi:hypothetical protein